MVCIWNAITGVKGLVTLAMWEQHAGVGRWTDGNGWVRLNA